MPASINQIKNKKEQKPMDKPSEPTDGPAEPMHGLPPQLLTGGGAPLAWPGGSGFPAVGSGLPATGSGLADLGSIARGRSCHLSSCPPTDPRLERGHPPPSAAGGERRGGRGAAPRLRPTHGAAPPPGHAPRTVPEWRGRVR
jgi:hypothetical protein